MQLHEEYRSDGLVVLAVSDEGLDKVAPYAAAYGLTFPVGAGSGTGRALGKLVGARGIPHSYLIDPSGELVWHGHPSSLTDKVVSSALRGADKLGEKGVLAWRGEVEGAPAEALECAAEGDLAKAYRALGGDESPGAKDLRTRLDGHVALLTQQVESAFERRDVRQALEVLDVLADELGAHPSGPALAARLKEARKDKAIQAELDAHTALDRALELGRKRGMKKARKSLERLVDNYPGTKAAERASMLLRQL